ncbi:MAG TPA: DUF6582 domain-containing protein [Candidatus Limnocylindria bacterium]
MPEMSTKQRERLDRDEFAYVDSKGGEHLPINDETHVRNAISRFGQTDFEDAGAKKDAAQKILRAARRHDIEVSDDADVMRAAH